MRIKYCNEIIDVINNGIKISAEAFKIGESAILGMLYEVSTSPSPGLVSPYSTGSHNDMNFLTFLASTASIAHAMYICAQIGIDYNDDILMKIRTVGIQTEKNMMCATKGINTQRGLLFLAGVVAAACGNCIKNKEQINRYTISNNIKIICKGIVYNELNTIKDINHLTNGEKLYLKYGLTGIRGEVENGLPSILNTSIKMYEDALNFGLTIEAALSHTLVGLMSVVEDTTVVNRCGMKGLNIMSKMSKKAVDLGGMKTLEGRKYINKMEDVFLKNNISPGGAADLLAITVMIHKLEDVYCMNK